MRNSVKYLAALTFVLLWLCAAAMAEMHIGEQAPESWAQREDILRITQLDTNRSDCLLVEAYGRIMLVDGGYPGTVGHVRDVLEARGLRHFDWILNTHPHDDHIVGADILIREGYTADVFLSPFPKNYNDRYQRHCVRALDKADIPYVQTEDGYRFTITGGEDALPVEITLRTTGMKDVNLASALTVIRFGESRALLMADLTLQAQKRLMQMMTAQELKCDVVKAPHHGITTFDTEFLGMLAPGYVSIPNKDTKNNRTGVQCRRAGIPYGFSGEGDLLMQTDGVDWYIWQLPQAPIPRRN